MLGVDSMIPKDGRGAYAMQLGGGYLGPYPGQQMRQPYPCDMYPTNLSQQNYKCKEFTGIPMLDGKDDEERPLSPPPQRERFSYTRYQLELLNGIYVKIRYPNSYQKQLIAKRVGITRDQVKIWFQNRRRKDVIASQSKTGNKSPESDTSDSEPANKMVPGSIMESVLSELVSFENDPKGKKLKAQIERQSHRSRPYNVSSRRGGSSGSNKGSPTSGDITPPMLSPQNTSDLSASPIDAFYQQQSPEGSLQSPTQTSPVQDLVPSSLQLDMVAPPNTVAPQVQVSNRPPQPRLSTSPEREDDEDSNSPAVQPFTTMAYPYYLAAPHQPYAMGGVDTDGRPIPFDRVFPIPLVTDPSTMLSAMPNFNPDVYSNALKNCQPTGGMRIRDPYQPIFMTPYNNHHQMRNSTTGPCNKSYTAL